MKRVQAFLNTKVGSVINVGLYMVGAAAITAAIDYLSGLKLTDSSVVFALSVQVVNLILVAIKQKYFKK